MANEERRQERRKDRRRDVTGRVTDAKDGFTVSHLVGPGVTESVMARLMDYFNECEAYSADAIIFGLDRDDAAAALADIAEDILCFKVTHD